MRPFVLNRKETLGEEDYPLRGFHARVQVAMDLRDAPVPAKAQRRIALRLLRELVEEARPIDLSPLRHAMSQPAARRGGDEADEPEGEPEEWDQPGDVDLRLVKSAHRVIQEVARRAQTGRLIMASDLIGASGLSAPTIGRLLREGDPAFEYLQKYVHVSQQGRTKALDLTREGRLLASKIRAGVVPS